MSLERLNDLFKNADLSKVSSDGAGFEDLPDGYYLSELESIEYKESKSGKDMIAAKFKVVEDGLKEVVDEHGDTELVEAEKTKGRYIFKNWVLSDESSLKRYASDMLKFEIENDTPILEKECFLDTDVLFDALEAIKGMRIYIMVQSNEKNGQKNINYNLVKWSTIRKLGISD